MKRSTVCAGVMAFAALMLWPALGQADLGPPSPICSAGIDELVQEGQHVRVTIAIYPGGLEMRHDRYTLSRVNPNGEHTLFADQEYVELSNNPDGYTDGWRCFSPRSTCARSNCYAYAGAQECNVEGDGESGCDPESECFDVSLIVSVDEDVPPGLAEYVLTTSWGSQEVTEHRASITVQPADASDGGGTVDGGDGGADGGGDGGTDGDAGGDVAPIRFGSSGSGCRASGRLFPAYPTGPLALLMLTVGLVALLSSRRRN